MQLVLSFYLMVTLGYLAVASGYLAVTSSYFWFLVWITTDREFYSKKFFY